VGRTIEEVATERDIPPAFTVLDLLVEEEAGVNVISFNQSVTNLRQLITHPLCSVISDGFYVNGKAHPRLYGTFPELLGRVTRELGWMELPNAIHKITAQPAARLRLTDRGLLRSGCFADVTIFDPATIRSLSTYDDPDREPEGIVSVIKDGKFVYGRSA
jgi:dihydroorotase/N-acyl-D-amino-acid deacylase